MSVRAMTLNRQVKKEIMGHGGISRQLLRVYIAHDRDLHCRNGASSGRHRNTGAAVTLQAHLPARITNKTGSRQGTKESRHTRNCILAERRVSESMVAGYTCQKRLHTRTVHNLISTLAENPGFMAQVAGQAMVFVGADLP